MGLEQTVYEVETLHEDELVQLLHDRSIQHLTDAKSSVKNLKTVAINISDPELKSVFIELAETHDALLGYLKSTIEYSHLHQSLDTKATVQGATKAIGKHISDNNLEHTSNIKKHVDSVDGGFASEK